MRIAKLLLINLIFALSSFAQESKLVQWKSIVIQGKKDSATLIALDSLQNWYYSYRTDSGIYYAGQLKVMATELGHKKYVGIALRIISTKYFIEGRTTEALKLLYESLAIAEKTKDTTSICASFMNIGNSYKEYGDYFKANAIYKKGYEIASKHNSDLDLAVAAVNLGYSYEKLNQLDSAFYFEQQAYIINTKIRKNLAVTESYLADLNFKLGNIKLAKAYYESALIRVGKTKEIFFGSRTIVNCYLGLANCYKSLNNTDSAFTFSKNGLIVAQKIKYLKGIRDAQKILSELFDKKQQIDSAYFYQKLYISTSDSLYNRDKSSTVESLAFEQDLKDQERRVEIQKQTEERNHNIQLAITAIAILTAIILFLLLSRSILVSHKVVEFLSVIVLLVVFEFINLLIHPFLERITHHSPVLMLLALVAIAALIVPLHHRLEHWTTKLLVEKNKAIRLAQAKRTIEELEQPKS
jgi:tetratricopeptide (TPR) repeat protein